MTNRSISPPFLPEAPIYDDLLESGKLTDPWRNWFNSITRVTGYAITHARFSNSSIAPDVTKGNETAIIEVTRFTETQRDELVNPRDGAIIYNLTTDRFNFREGGAWVTFTPVAA